jgi:hypothetical protein
MNLTQLSADYPGAVVKRLRNSNFIRGRRARRCPRVEVGHVELDH